jgi:phage portal protein BeeE
MRYGKIHPKTGHEVQGVRQIYSSTLSLTSTLDRNGWSTSHLEEGMRPTKNIDVNVRI